MKKAFLTTLLWLSAAAILAQDRKGDSLRTLFAAHKDDTAKVALAIQLEKRYYPNKDSFYKYVSAGLEISRKIGYRSGEANANISLGFLYSDLGNFTESLRCLFLAAQIYEQIKDTVGIENSLIELGAFYYFQNEYRTAVNFFDRAARLAAAGHLDTGYFLLSITNLGDVYTKLGQLDSALYCSNLVYHSSAGPKFDKKILPDALTNLGDIYSKLNQPAVAAGYYRIAMHVSLEIGDYENYCESGMGMAELFRREGKADSSLIYANRSYAYALENRETSRQILATAFIADGYKAQKKTDSAFKYLELTGILKDSLYNQEKLKSIQNMTAEENLRQQELAKEKIEAAEQASRNLQRTGIAAFIPAFFLFLLVLSQTKVKSRTVEFLAVVGLLLFFEFICDLLYPYISDWTHESPVGETLIFVLLAALLESVSHKLESWIKARLARRGSSRYPTTSLS